MIKFLRDFLTSMVVMSLLVVLTVTISIGTLIAVPFMMITSKFFNWPYNAPDQEVVDEYYSVYEAMSSGDIKFLEDFAASNSDFPSGVDGFLGRHWLTNAVDSGNVAAVDWILNQRVDVNYFDDEGFSPLSSAIDDQVGNAVPIIKRLIAAGADVNAPGTLDVTALHVAASYGSPEVVEVLLENGANPLAYDSEYTAETPIDRAKFQKRYDIVTLMQNYSK